MPENRSVGGFNFHDFLTRIVPGIVVISPVLLGVFTLGTPVQSAGLIDSLFVLGLVGLLAGEIIEVVRSTFFHVPVPFKSVIYHYTNDRITLSKWDRVDLWLKDILSPLLNRIPNRVSKYVSEGDLGRRTVFSETDRDFREVFESQFKLQFDSHSPNALYSIFLSYMEPRMSTMTRRNQTIRVFSQNLMIASIFGGLLALNLILNNIDDIQVVGWSILLLFVLFLLVELTLFLSTSAYPFIDYLIVDYYVDRVAEP